MSQKHRVFLSYSSKDQPAADAICRALEAQGIGTWIAPRDIKAGSQWGGSIVEAIEGCEAVLVVFSDAANGSPQVAREMEVAVANRRPLIPVRIADAQPTDDMKYFLGVSHWLNAYERPLEGYLTDIVAATRRVLDKQTSPLARVARFMPRSRNGQIMVAGGAVVLVALLTASLMRPPAMSEFKMPENPMTGRWQASLPNAEGKKVTCIFDVQAMGQAAFSDTCPMPLTGSFGSIAAVEGSVWAPGLYKDGDNGTFLVQGGSNHGLAGAFRTRGSRLVTRDAQFGEVTWKRISAKKPLENAIDKVIPTPPDWPLSNMPEIAERAIAYARSHWKQDAQLLSIEADLLDGQASYTKLVAPAGAIDVKMRFYSPASQEGMQLNPGASYGAIFSFGTVDWGHEQPLPEKFVDLPTVVEGLRQQGMRALQIKEAELKDWGERTWVAGKRVSGLAWHIRSALDENAVVSAVEPQ